MLILGHRNALRLLRELKPIHGICEATTETHHTIVLQKNGFRRAHPRRNLILCTWESHVANRSRFSSRQLPKERINSFLRQIVRWTPANTTRIITVTAAASCSTAQLCCCALPACLFLLSLPLILLSDSFLPSFLPRSSLPNPFSFFRLVVPLPAYSFSHPLP